MHRMLVLSEYVRTSNVFMMLCVYIYVARHRREMVVIMLNWMLM